jgi:toxin YoeB
MEISITDKAREDLAFWRKSGNANIQKKISKLIDSLRQTPFEGLGKPEPLKHTLTGTWSRRIDREHRMVYEVEEERIVIHSLRGHY